MRKILFALYLLTLTPLLISCATKLEIPPYGIIETDEEDLADCEYLDEVEGWVEWERKKNKRNTESARFDAYTRAALLGATHIIWVRKKEEHLTSVTGHAYLCR